MIKQFTKFCKSPIAVYMQPIYLQIGCIFLLKKWDKSLKGKSYTRVQAF